MKITLKKTAFYIITLMLAFYGYLYTEDQMNLAQLQKQELTSAQSIQENLKLKAISSVNQSGSLLTGTKSEETIWVGSSGQNQNYLSLIFDISKIPVAANISRAYLLLTPSEDSGMPINMLIFAEKSQSISAPANNNLLSLRPLTEGFVVYTLDTPWSQDVQVQTPEIENLINEARRFGSTQKVHILIKGLDAKNQKRPIYSANVEENAPMLNIEYSK